MDEIKKLTKNKLIDKITCKLLLSITIITATILFYQETIYIEGLKEHKTIIIGIISGILIETLYRVIKEVKKYRNIQWHLPFAKKSLLTKGEFEGWIYNPIAETYLFFTEKEVDRKGGIITYNIKTYATSEITDRDNKHKYITRKKYNKPLIWSGADFIVPKKAKLLEETFSYGGEDITAKVLQQRQNKIDIQNKMNDLFGYKSEKI